MQLDQHKSVGHPAFSGGKDRLKDDHARVSVDALSNMCAGRKLEESSGQHVLYSAHLGRFFTVGSAGPYGLRVWHYLRPVRLIALLFRIYW